jgi:hypothetical protein
VTSIDHHFFEPCILTESNAQGSIANLLKAPALNFGDEPLALKPRYRWPQAVADLAQRITRSARFSPQPGRCESADITGRRWPLFSTALPSITLQVLHAASIVGSAGAPLDCQTLNCLTISHETVQHLAYRRPVQELLISSLSPPVMTPVSANMFSKCRLTNIQQVPMGPILKTTCRYPRLPRSISAETFLPGTPSLLSAESSAICQRLPLNAKQLGRAA